MTTRLRVTLYFIAAYLAVFGILFLFAPKIFEQITGSTLPDLNMTFLYGQYTLTFAVVALMAAREKEAKSKLSLTVLIVTAGNALAFGYLLAAGRERFSQAGPPLVVNFVLTALLLVFWRKPT